MTHLVNHGTVEQKRFLQKTLGNKHVPQRDIQTIQKILKDSGSYAYIADLKQTYVREAKQAISTMEIDAQTAQILDSLVDFVVTRTS